MAWRGLVLGVVTVGLVACDRDPRPVCGDVYEHLLELAGRSDDAALRSRFVDACSEAYDPERLACIRASVTAGEALACKPVRKRPS